jgi:hypothetical protein
MSTSSTPYSLDKQKRWETLEATERKIRDGRRALTQSYSDTDDISDDESWSSEDEEKPGGAAAIPGKVVVLKMQELDHEGRHKEEMIKGTRQLVVQGILKQELVNEPVTDTTAAEEKQRWPSKGRKGFEVRERRPRGKKGVVKATKRNTHAEEVYDLARADSLVIVTEPIDPKRNYLVRNFKEHEFGCECSLCFYSDVGNRTKKKRIFHKELLDQL